MKLFFNSSLNTFVVKLVVFPKGILFIGSVILYIYLLKFTVNLSSVDSCVCSSVRDPIREVYVRKSEKCRNVFGIPPTMS